MIVGGYFTWISVYGINQTQVQRYLTVKEKRQAVKYAIFANSIDIIPNIFRDIHILCFVCIDFVFYQGNMV